MRDDDGAPWWETLIGVLETGGAFVACAVIASVPVWVGLVLGPTLGPLGFMVSAVLLLLAPALLPLPDRPELDAPRRWGTRMGRLLGAPLRLAARRQRARRHRALGASTSSSSTATPSLPPRT